MTIERDGSFPASGRGFRATSGHAPSVWEHTASFLQDFETLFYLFGRFFSIQIWLGG